MKDSTVFIQSGRDAIIAPTIEEIERQGDRFVGRATVNGESVPFNRSIPEALSLFLSSVALLEAMTGEDCEALATRGLGEVTQRKVCPFCDQTMVAGVLLGLSAQEAIEGAEEWAAGLNRRLAKKEAS